VDQYLGALPAEQRATLERLRKTIQAAVPEAVETISYRIPTYRLGATPLVGFGAAANHCSFHVMSGTVLPKFASELEGYSLGKGTIQFPIGGSLPAALVRKLVKARIAEVRSR
jgi:uncharacterized protein YdhG (YjbR/CyaY superfamily)